MVGELMPNRGKKINSRLVHSLTGSRRTLCRIAGEHKAIEPNWWRLYLPPTKKRQWHCVCAVCKQEKVNNAENNSKLAWSLSKTMEVMAWKKTIHKIFSKKWWNVTHVTFQRTWDPIVRRCTWENDCTTCHHLPRVWIPFSSTCWRVTTRGLRVSH
jgi:hypothetical protein